MTDAVETWWDVLFWLPPEPGSIWGEGRRPRRYQLEAPSENVAIVRATAHLFSDGYPVGDVLEVVAPRGENPHQPKPEHDLLTDHTWLLTERHILDYPVRKCIQCDMHHFKHKGDWMQFEEDPADATRDILIRNPTDRCPVGSAL